MGKAFGALAAVVGLGAGWLFLTPDEGDRMAADRLASVVRIAVDSGASGSRPPPELPSTLPVSSPAIAETPNEARQPVPRRTPQAQGTQLAQARTAPPKAAPHGIRPSDDEARRALAGAIQGELKRLGCYDGAVDGLWSAATRRAMATFNERVNARLPIDEPDYILLTLLQGETARACALGCPTGQVLSGDGRCTPRAVVAQSDRRSSAQPEPLPGRMDAGAAVREPRRTREALAEEARRAEAEAALRRREAAEAQKAEAARARAEAEERKRAEAATRGRQAAERAQEQAAETRRRQEAQAEERRQRLEVERERLEAQRAAQAAHRQKVLEAAERARAEAAEARRQQLAETEARKARLAAEVRERAAAQKQASPPAKVAAAEAAPAVSVTQSNASAVVPSPLAAQPASGTTVAGSQSGSPSGGPAPALPTDSAAATPAAPSMAPDALGGQPPVPAPPGVTPAPPAAGKRQAPAAPRFAVKRERREAREARRLEGTRSAQRREGRGDGPRPTLHESIFRKVASQAP